MNNSPNIDKSYLPNTPIHIIRTMPKREGLEQDLLSQKIVVFFMTSLLIMLGFFISIFMDNWFWIIVITLFNPLSFFPYIVIWIAFKNIQAIQYVLGKYDEFPSDFLFLEINQNGFSVFSAEQKLRKTINFKDIKKIHIGKFNKEKLNLITITEKNSEKFYLDISFFEIFNANIDNETMQLTAHHIYHLLNNFYQQSKFNT